VAALTLTVVIPAHNEEAGLPETLAAVIKQTMAPQQQGGRIVCLIPAYNEEESIVRTVESLRRQTRVPDLIVVLANNCTDRTAERVRSTFLPGVITEDLQFPGMSGKAKAHALNYG
jgi:glycosyltransferase involved in cell wall biosynthesis